MPFTPTNVEPSIDSKVTVTFSGLMLLKPGANNTLEVGIHKLNRDHAFQVFLIVKKTKNPPKLIRLFSGPLHSNLEMVVNDPGAGIQTFVSPNKTFDAQSERNNPLDFRWAFNFAALPGHERVDLNDGAKPMATLNSGVIYASNLSGKNRGLVLESVDNEIPVYQFAADLAVSVDFKGTQMTFKWTGGPQPDFVLPRISDEDDTTYTVALVNDPPSIKRPAHDEFEEYYKILQIDNRAVPNDLRYKFKGSPKELSDEIPCLAGILVRPGE